ncbi:MAG: hypothetical protein AAGF92_09160 [Myxococcota bacterium]
MKHLLVSLALVLGVMFVTPTPTAHAWSWSSLFSWGKKKANNKAKKWESYKKGNGGGRSVPELDPSVAGSSLVLLVGGVAYVMSRRREDEDLV